MRRPLLTTLMSTALVTAPGGVVDAETDAQLLVMPTAELTASFPTGWRIWTDPAVEESFAWTGTDFVGHQWCSMLFLEGATSAEEAAPYWDGFETSESMAVQELRPLTVPAGEAMYARYRYVLEEDPLGPTTHEYHVPATAGVLRVRCYAYDGPRSDGFLPIIETIGPLSADTPASTPFDPRIELPELGLALELPKKWDVSFAADTATGVLFGGELAFIAFDMKSRSARRCELETVHDATLAASMTTEFLRASVDQMEVPAWASADVVVAEHELPAGLATRLDIDLPDGSSASAWVFADHDRVVALVCRSASRPPSNRWHSIAESLEAIPESP